VRPVIEWIKRHPLLADSFVAVVVMVIGIVNIWLAPESDGAMPYRDGNALAVLLVIGSTLPLAWRRRDPILTFWVVNGCAVAYEVVGFPSNAGFASVLAVYTVAAHCERRQSRQLLGATAALILLVLLTARFDMTFADYVGVFFQYAAVWLLGDNLQTRRKYVASLEDRAERAEREKVLEAQQAVEQEQTRIARELHDVVAHSMSVMIVQAGAARRVVGKDPAQAEEAIGRVEATGREAMTEMRRLLGVLRQQEDEGARAPQPTLGGLEGLLSQCEEAGLPVSLAIVGTRRELPPGVELSAFRIVQEALTNVLKHAGPARAEVRIHYGEDAIDLEVLDDGRGAAAADAAADPGGGHGLAGMHERVELFDGQLHAGPRPGGGFAVRAKLSAVSTSAATGGI